MESCHACSNIARVEKCFQNTWTKGHHISMSMDIVNFKLLMYQKTTIHYSRICEQYIPYITICFPNVTHEWLHIKN
jgi:hypothetical protein